MVVQIRQAVRGRRWTRIRKNYYLIGTNEDGTAFAHPVSAMCVHHAIRAGQDVVRRVQDWIFDCDYGQVRRQGDLALIPLRRACGERRFGRWWTRMRLRRADRLGAAGWCTPGPAPHPAGAHPTVAADGWHKVITGRRASFWKFAAPTVD